MHAAVLGHPIAHSLSPTLHNAAYQALGLDDWHYDAIDIEPAGLPELLTEKLLKRDDWMGFSVTMPLKPEIVPWLLSRDVQDIGADIAISPLVTATGAANTLFRNKSKCLCAENTDVYGIIAALREVVRHGPIEEIAILGAGATAASALAAAQKLGAQQIVVYTRPGSASLPTLREVATRLGVTFLERELAATASELATYDAVVSTMPKHAADSIAADLKQVGGVLLDVVYDPRPTELQSTWSALGGAIVGGERMLLHQAARQVELMTGQPAPLKAMDDALLRKLEAE